MAVQDVQDVGAREGAAERGFCRRCGCGLDRLERQLDALCRVDGELADGSRGQLARLRELCLTFGLGLGLHGIAEPALR